MPTTKHLILKGDRLKLKPWGGRGFTFVNASEEPVYCSWDGTTLSFVGIALGSQVKPNRRKHGEISWLRKTPPSSGTLSVPPTPPTKN